MNEKKKILFPLEDVLPELSLQRGWEEQLELHSLFVRWNEILTSDITEHCQPLKIVKNILWIEADNSAWIQQFQFQTVLLLELLNKSLRISKLKGLRFCVKKELSKTKKPVLCLTYTQPSAYDIANFEQQTESISDDKVKGALVHFWYLSKACKVKSYD